jgi:hypothetical protein
MIFAEMCDGCWPTYYYFYCLPTPTTTTIVAALLSYDGRWKKWKCDGRRPPAAATGDGMALQAGGPSGNGEAAAAAGRNSEVAKWREEHPQVKR